MPGGTFLGAGVKTIVLFFEKGKPTQNIWYYQLNPSRNMGKTNPLNDKDMAEFIELQKTFATSENSWTVNVNDIGQATFDLSVNNPIKKEGPNLRHPQAILEEMKALDKDSAETIKSILELI